MRFLLDANLSPRLTAALIAAGHVARHVDEIGLLGESDIAIFDRAAEDGDVLITADTDFTMLLAARGSAGPSVVLLRHVAELPWREHQALLLVTEQVPHGGQGKRPCHSVVHDDAYGAHDGHRKRDVGGLAALADELQAVVAAVLAQGLDPQAAHLRHPEAGQPHECGGGLLDGTCLEATTPMVHHSAANRAGRREACSAARRSRRDRCAGAGLILRGAVRAAAPQHRLRRR